jgi:hypothetical protein
MSSAYFNFEVKFKMAILCCFLAQCHQYGKMACLWRGKVILNYVVSIA